MSASSLDEEALEELAADLGVGIVNVSTEPMETTTSEPTEVDEEAVEILSTELSTEESWGGTDAQSVEFKCWQTLKFTEQLDRSNMIHVAFEWKDQGYYDRKGGICIVKLPSEEVVASKEPALHEWRRCNLYFQPKPTATGYDIRYRVGWSQYYDHELHIKNLQVTQHVPLTEADGAAIAAIFREAAISEGYKEEDEIKKKVEEWIEVRTATNKEGRQVVQLDLSNFSSMISLPPDIGELRHLQKLNLRLCRSLELLPPEIRELNQLQDLNLSYCTSLKSIPPKIGEFQQLQHLNLRGCYNLESFPPNIGELQQLSVRWPKRGKAKMSASSFDEEAVEEVPTAELSTEESWYESYDEFESWQTLKFTEHLDRSNTIQVAFDWICRNPNRDYVYGEIRIVKIPSEEVVASNERATTYKWSRCVLKFKPESAVVGYDIRYRVGNAENFPNELHIRNLRVTQPRPLTKADRAAIAAIFREAAISEGYEKEDEIKEKVKEWVEERTETSRKGRAIRLDLRGLSMTSLPPEIGMLRQLLTLVLRECRSLEYLPPEIGELQHLQELNLYRCEKLKSLPPEIEELRNLQKLNLQYCSNLRFFPPEIVRLQQLTEIPVDYCRSLQVPAGLTGKTSVHVEAISLFQPNYVQTSEEGWVLNLDLMNKQFVSLPPEIVKLQQLNNLQLNDSNLKSLPSEFVQLQQLRLLGFKRCARLHSPPPEIWHLQKLQVLYLRNCNFSSRTLPPEIVQLQQLRLLWLDGWKLDSILPEIGQLKQLRSLNFRDCDLEFLPPEIGQLLHLEDLYLNGNRWNSLPPEIGQLHELRKLNLCNCPALISLPPEIGQLHELRKLNLCNCLALISLPHEIGGLEQLTILEIKCCESLIVPPPRAHPNDNAIAFMKRVHRLHFDVEEDSDLSPLFSAAEHYPSLAPKFGQLIARDKTIADIKDDRGRTLLEMSCKECKREMRAARLFYRRYDMEDQPKYESKTCKVFFAVDYGDEEGGEKGTPVAMKFVEEKSHLVAELEVRRYDDGEPRFHEDYVVADLCHYDGSNKEFKQAADSRHLPPHCLVLEQGERNLYEAIASENLYDPQNRFRVIDILHQLGECLQYLHKKSYIHGDFKPKNAVRETHSRKWQLIDFDAAVKIGDHMGRKVSTAYLPPEFIKLHNGRPILKGLCACTADEAGEIPGIPRSEDKAISEDEVLVAAESVDVWSFGVMAFSLLSDGKSLFGGMDPRENLNVNGLKELSRWSDYTLERKLKLVPDVAKDFLRRVLHPNPKKRPNMDEILEHEFFSTDSLFQKKHKLEMQLQEARKSGGDVEAKVHKLKKQIENLTNEVKNQHIETRKELEKPLFEINEKLHDVSSGILELNEKLESYHKSTANMLVSLLKDKDTMPKFMCILPVIPKKGSKKLKHWCNPNNWVKEEVKVYFLCPITMENVGEGYTLTSLKDWVKKYGPALHTSLTVLRVACGVGRLAGLPIPNLNDVAEGLSEKLSGQTAFLSTLSEVIAKPTETLEDAGLGFMTEATKAKWESIMEVEVADLPEEQKTVVVESYKEIAEVVDDDYKRSGLVKAICPKDGSVEYVSHKVKDLFEKHGREIIGLSEKQLFERMAQLEHEEKEDLTEKLKKEKEDLTEELMKEKENLTKELMNMLTMNDELMMEKEKLTKKKEELKEKIEEPERRTHHFRRWMNKDEEPRADNKEQSADDEK